MLLTTVALWVVASVHPIQAQSTEAALTIVPSRDKKIVRRWSLPGDPRGAAVGSDGTIYVGLAEPQAVIAVDPSTGAVRKRVVLDSAEIASTKELVTLRTDPRRTRLYIANGSDESATILSLPGLGVLREITMEGEIIRDVVPDPKGRYVYVLGRRIHVFDGEADTELRTLPLDEPMAIAPSSDGTMLAVFFTEDYGYAKATSVAIYDTGTFAEIGREPLQTDKAIEGATFAANNHAVVGFARDAIFEKPLSIRPTRIKEQSGTDAAMRVVLGELVNSYHVCLPNGSGPQVATLAQSDVHLVYAERRCSASGMFAGSKRSVLPISLYGVDAYAATYDRKSNTIVTTERAGFLTIYRIPSPKVAK